MARDLGKAIAVDVMIMWFKAIHQDELGITCKSEGQGFQADAFCDDGYCYQIYISE